MSKSSEPSKSASVPTPADETASELDEEQLERVSGGIIVINGRDATTAGALDAKMGPSPHMNVGDLVTPKTGG